MRGFEEKMIFLFHTMVGSLTKHEPRVFQERRKKGRLPGF
jgi:hypothetical protein